MIVRYHDFIMGERLRELVLLLFGDVLFFIVALWLTLSVRYLSIPTEEVFSLHFWPFLYVSVVWIFIYYIGGLYDKHTVFLKSLLKSRIIIIQIINIIVAGLIFFNLPLGITPKINLVIYLFISSTLMLWWRLRLFMLFSPKLTHKALLIASGEEASELVDEVNNNERYNYMFVRMIDDVAALSTEDFEKKVLDIIERENISIIIANPRTSYVEKLLPALFDLTLVKFELTFLDFFKVYEDTFDRIPLSSLRYDWFLEHISQSSRIGYLVSKRTIDIVGSIFLGIVFIFLLPIIVFAMKVEGKGSILITQERIGKHNRTMKIHKIRTMTQNENKSDVWIGENENKVTKVGAILRKLSIDEIPQIFSILKGEMSLIGPRNDMVGLAKRLSDEIPYYNIRNFTKPGVTGWAQTHQHYMGNNISPQSIEDTRTRLAYDLYYVKNRSFLLDASIALRTIKTLLSRFGFTL